MTQVIRRVHHHSTGRRSGGGGTVRSGLAQQFPAFQLGDAQLSSVKVMAQSPSGRIQQLGVQVDPAGQFTTDFVPNEIGRLESRIGYSCNILVYINGIIGKISMTLVTDFKNLNDNLTILYYSCNVLDLYSWLELRVGTVGL